MVLKPSEILKPGMIGVNLKGSFDLLGTLDTILQGDTQASHVWWVLPNGKIATTGADWMVMYGEADPDKYLNGKSCYLLETIEPLTSAQLSIMEACHQALMKSGAGRLYGLWKFGVIWSLCLVHGEATRAGLKPTTKRPTCPICSQAVAYPFWTAGVHLGESQGKEDWSAVLPETILSIARDHNLIQPLQLQPFRF